MVLHAQKQYQRLFALNPIDEDALCRLLGLLHRQGMIDDLRSAYEQAQKRFKQYEQAGGWMEAWQTAEVEAEGEPASERERPLERCVFSPDGAMISLVHKQWAEVRTVAIGEPQEKRKASGEVEIHVGKLSYFSRLADVSTFTRLAEVEMRRRRVKDAKEVRAIMDGADWCQLFTDKHRPDAVRMLDFPHAGEHINDLLEALEKVKMHFPPHILERCLHILKHRGPRPLLRMADRLESNLAEQKGVHEHLDYLRKREALMQYPQFLRDGWPIGSGMVESANRRKQHTARNRVKYSHQRSGEVSGETCVCGTPLVQSKGSGRTKQYCSNACRQRAYRERQAEITRYSEVGCLWMDKTAQVYSGDYHPPAHHSIIRYPGPYCLALNKAHWGNRRKAQMPYSYVPA
jgi:hypothetical protein